MYFLLWLAFIVIAGASLFMSEPATYIRAVFPYLMLLVIAGGVLALLAFPKAWREARKQFFGEKPKVGQVEDE